MNDFLNRLMFTRDNAATWFLVGLMAPITVFLLLQLAQDPDIFFVTFLRGLGLGSTYAIVALGFVLIFKATQTVNFAQGSLAVAGAL